MRRRSTRTTSPATSGRAARCCRPRERARCRRTTGFDDLFSLDAVDELLSRRGLRTPFIRIAKDGVVVPTGRYTRSGGTGAQIGRPGRRRPGARPVPRRPHRRAAGAAPALAAADRLRRRADDRPRPSGAGQRLHHAPARRRASPRTTTCTTCSCCRSPARSAGASTSRCTPIRCATSPGPTAAAAVEARAQEAPVIDAVLRPGDALYLPRGYLHAAEALGERHLPPDRRRPPGDPARGARGAARRSWPTSPRCGARCRWASTSATQRPSRPTCRPPSTRSSPGCARSTAAEVADRLAARLVAQQPAGTRRRRSRRPRPWTRSTPSRCSSPGRTCGTSLPRRRTTSSSLALPDRTLAAAARRPARRCAALLDGERLRVARPARPGPATDALALARRLVREAVVVVDGRSDRDRSIDRRTAAALLGRGAARAATRWSARPRRPRASCSIEQPGPWGRQALTGVPARPGRSGRAVSARAIAPGLRALLIRRPGPAPAPGPARAGPSSSSRPGREASWWGDFGADDELLDAPAGRQRRHAVVRPVLSWSARTAGTTPAARSRAGRSPPRWTRLRPGRGVGVLARRRRPVRGQRGGDAARPLLRPGDARRRAGAGRRRTSAARCCPTCCAAGRRCAPAAQAARRTPGRCWASCRIDALHPGRDPAPRRRPVAGPAARSAAQRHRHACRPRSLPTPGCSPVTRSNEAHPPVFDVLDLIEVG